MNAVRISFTMFWLLLFLICALISINQRYFVLFDWLICPLSLKEVVLERVHNSSCNQHLTILLTLLHVYVRTYVGVLASLVPGPIPAFQCCSLKEKKKSKKVWKIIIRIMLGASAACHDHSDIS